MCREKSKTIYALTHSNCFSEDTGLEVESLRGEPGVKSARYGGEEKDFQKNIDKLLKKLENDDRRNARFRTVISLIWNDEQFFFDGVCEGKIIHAQKGSKGFGYDPVFLPDGSDKSFAEMSKDEKNRFSHRRKAGDLLVAFLKTGVIQ